MANRIPKGEVGYLSTLIHDSMNNIFAKQDKFYLINKIDCYYTDTSIIGFFPFFNDDALNKEILESSYYTQFKQDKIYSQCLIQGMNLKHEETKFYKGESISYIKVVYDENQQRINALKFSTQNKIYSYGNHTLFNKRETITLMKRDNFITGLKTSYIREKEIPYLSFVRAHFDKEDNFHKYYNNSSKTESRSCCCNPFRHWVTAYSVSSKVIGLVLKLIILLSAILVPWFAYYYTSQNFYGGWIQLNPVNSNYKLRSRNDNTKVYTDPSGFTHIKADSNWDAYFALGFEHAKNRLWQMDSTRRSARGTLSEIFGERTITVDTTIRSLGLNEWCKKGARFVRGNSKYLNEWNTYIDGINFYAEHFILPIEYQIWNAKFTKWTLEDTISILNFYSFAWGHDWSMELFYTTWEESLGKEFADVVFSYRDWNYPYWNETIVNDDEWTEMGMHQFRRNSEEIIQRERDLIGKKKKEKQEKELKEKEEREAKKKESEWRLKEEEEKTKADERSKKQEERKWKEAEKKNKKEEHSKEVHGQQGDVLNKKDNDEDWLITGPLQNEGASNCWVVSGNHTESGKPILSNDPHLPHGMPSLFFITKLYLPNMIISGASLPGTPFIATGSNNYISWGWTTENSDNTDICQELIEDDFYIYNKRKYPLSFTSETILVKNSESLNIEVVWTKHGPLLPKHLPKELLVLNRNYDTDLPLSFRSAFYNFNFTNFEFYFKLNHATSSKDFLPFVDLAVSPNYNLHWATVTGEIGWIPLGKFSVKNYKNRFCRGYTSEDDIIKYIPRNEIPKLISPEKGFIVTANNKLANFNYTYQLHGYHNHVRAYRIREMIVNIINSGHKIQVNNTAAMINDLKDSLAEYILPKLLTILERNNRFVKNNNYFINWTKWNYVMDKNSTVATIYSVLEREIGWGLLANKLDESEAKGIMNYLHYWNFVSGMIDKIYNGERIDMKQCAHQGGNINCEKYWVNVFNNWDFALQKYKDERGNVKQWGRIMFNDFPHLPFDKVPVWNRFFSKRVYTGGNRNTVKISRGQFNHRKGDFVGTQSARLKFVCDWIDPTQPYVIIPGGNGGNPWGKNYNNLMEAHENAELIKFENIDFDNVDQRRVITFKQEEM